ncbi:hypothetical protein D3C85_398770 [compost metagenome]
MFAGQFADLRRHLINALGHHLRCAARILAILQRHRVMGRIGYHHVGRRHVGHHAAARHFMLHLAYLRLDLRIAVRLFRFLLDFLQGHFHLVGVVPHLVRTVDSGDQAQGAHDQQKGRDQQADQMGRTGAQRFHRQAQHGILLMLHHHPGDDADDESLGDGLEQLHQRILRKHIAQATNRVELAKIGGKRLGAEQPAAHQHGRGQGDEHDGRGVRQAGQQDRAHVVADAQHHRVGIEYLLPVQGQPGNHDGRQPPHDGVAGKPQAAAGRHQHRKRGHFTRSRNVAFLTRLLEALR